MIGKTNANTYYFRASYMDALTGKRIRKKVSGFKTKKEAKLAEEDFLRSESDSSSPSLFLEDVARDYLEHRKPYIQITSHLNNERIYEKYIFPYFKRKKLIDITKLDCRRFVDKVALLDRSTTTKNGIITLFKAAFKHAEEYYDLKSNPSNNLKRLPKEINEERKSDIWTIEEFEIFISSFDLNDSISYRWATFFTTVFWTGMRRGEALALTFDDVDFTNKTISINKSLTQKRKGQGVVIKSPKTKSSIRIVSLDDKTFSMILHEYNLRSNQPNFKTNQFIFCRPQNPYVPFSDTTIETRKNNICKKKNLKKIRFHDFRHSHASILIGNGVDIVVVSARLGHSSVDLTFKVYAHLLPSAERKAIETINRIR